ncbi:hypothetical protein DFH11DRAFT_1570801 [Phellopilus nigrolimitatus]|nr:hypothetical protein DFH11DRAFT_1570801 [Phellopilus nigrolimitatus]
MMAKILVQVAVFTVFLHTVVASPLYTPSNRSDLNARRVAIVPTVASSTTTAIESAIALIPDSGRTGRVAGECADAVEGLCP